MFSATGERSFNSTKYDVCACIGTGSADEDVAVWESSDEAELTREEEDEEERANEV